jgi:hypothetical protein
MRGNPVPPGRAGLNSVAGSSSSGSEAGPSQAPPPGRASKRRRIDAEAAGLPPRPGAASGLAVTPPSSPRNAPAHALPFAPFGNAAAAIPDDGFSTPVRATGMPEDADIENLKSTQFLHRHMKNAATLSKMTAYFSREACSSWAFTGSVALNLHAAKINQKTARDYADADIQLDPASYDTLVDKCRARGSREPIVPPAPRSGDTHYRFDGMDVDLVKGELGKAPVWTERELIDGIPVLSLEALKAHKTAAARGPHVEGIEKARRDLVTINELIEEAAKRVTAGAQPRPPERT